jgi:hypothetical protein
MKTGIATTPIGTLGSGKNNRKINAYGPAHISSMAARARSISKLMPEKTAVP